MHRRSQAYMAGLLQLGGGAALPTLPYLWIFIGLVAPGDFEAAAGRDGASNDTNQPQVLHTSTGKFNDTTRLMPGGRDNLGVDPQFADGGGGGGGDDDF